MLTQLAPKLLILESQMIIAADVSLQFSKLGYDVIGINTRSEDALKSIQYNRPDIIIMNIEMQGKTDGLKVARSIFDMYQIPVVFLSANTNLEVFNDIMDTKPYAFITKPFDKEGLKRGIETALKRMVFEGVWDKETEAFLSINSIFIQQKEHLIKVEFDEILFIEANRNYCQLSTTKEVYQLSVPLKKIAKQLPNSLFIRVHRSYLVSLHKIKNVHRHGEHLTIQNHKIPISRRLKSSVLKSIRRL